MPTPFGPSYILAISEGANILRKTFTYYNYMFWGLLCFNATFNNISVISWRSYKLDDEWTMVGHQYTIIHPVKKNI